MQEKDKVDSAPCDGCGLSLLANRRVGPDGHTVHHCRLDATLWCRWCKRQWTSHCVWWSPTLSRTLELGCLKCEWPGKVTWWQYSSPEGAKESYLRSLLQAASDEQERVGATFSTVVSQTPTDRKALEWPRRKNSEKTGQQRAASNQKHLVQRLPSKWQLPAGGSQGANAASHCDNENMTTPASGQKGSPEVMYSEERVTLGNLRFSQHTISNGFQDGRSLQELIDAFKTAGSIDAVLCKRSIIIKVVRCDGLLWSMDNRRLYCAKQAFDVNMELNVKLYSSPLHYSVETDTEDVEAKLFYDKFTTRCRGEKVRILPSAPSGRDDRGSAEDGFQDHVSSSEASEEESDPCASWQEGEEAALPDSQNEQRDHTPSQVPVESRDRSHRQDLCEACKLWGNCAGFFADPYIIKLAAQKIGLHPTSSDGSWSFDNGARLLCHAATGDEAE
eukprot:TRINITY_DN42546_c0_g2_i1.p1 TRINITY_DN42546_c0_g2~~TRINITY_DN42546_c0_g2_i1.p1  ORF type:complete len:446 (+),score=53.35 TRINITY_DN42546_c0_g2_i1:371-1708(+)